MSSATMKQIKRCVNNGKAELKEEDGTFILTFHRKSGDKLDLSVWGLYSKNILDTDLNWEVLEGGVDTTIKFKPEFMTQSRIDAFRKLIDEANA